MATTKLTLGVDAEVVAWAREISKERGTSISSLFSRYVRALRRPSHKRVEPGPLTLKAMAIGREVGKNLPPDFDAKRAMAEILAEKYGVKR